jgi:hypothetical protein
MIRLGSLAGYLFEGPRLLGGWTAPSVPAVFAVLYKENPDTRPDRYAVIYVGHSDNLAVDGFPFQHPMSDCWVARAGSRWKVHIATLEVAGGTRAHRVQIARELIAVYDPHCNPEKFDKAWKDQWIGEYSSAPTTGPLTQRGPDGLSRA